MCPYFVTFESNKSRHYVSVAGKCVILLKLQGANLKATMLASFSCWEMCYTAEADNLTAIKIKKGFSCWEMCYTAEAALKSFFLLLAESFSCWEMCYTAEAK